MELSKYIESVLPKEKEIPSPKQIPIGDGFHVSESDMHNAMGFNACLHQVKLNLAKAGLCVMPKVGEIIPLAYEFYRKATSANIDIAADFLAQSIISKLEVGR